MIGKKYLARGHYTINLFHYMTINKKANQKTCINQGDLIADNNHLKKIITSELKNEFGAMGTNWFWCFTHDGFIKILEDAGARCVLRKKRKKYDMRVGNLYRNWGCLECAECANISRCCISKKRKPSGRKCPAYYCLFTIAGSCAQTTID